MDIGGWKNEKKERKIDKQIHREIDSTCIILDTEFIFA